MKLVFIFLFICITGISDDDTGKQKWGEILQFFEHCVNTDSPDLKLTAMILLEAVPNIFGSNQSDYLQGIKSLLEKCLLHETSAVRSAAAKAFVAFVTMNDDDARLIKGFSGSVPHIVNVSTAKSRLYLPFLDLQTCC